MLNNLFEGDLKKRTKVNIIPLIDIIFLMLVFFMLATNFDINKQIELSVNEGISLEKNEPKILKIILKNNGEYDIGGEEISKIKIESKITSLWFKNKYDQVFILNQKNAVMQDLIYLMDILKDNEIDKIFFDDLND